MISNRAKQLVEEIDSAACRTKFEAGSVLSAVRRGGRHWSEEDRSYVTDVLLQLLLEHGLGANGEPNRLGLEVDDAIDLIVGSNEN